MRRVLASPARIFCTVASGEETPLGLPLRKAQRLSFFLLVSLRYPDSVHQVRQHQLLQSAFGHQGCSHLADDRHRRRSVRHLQLPISFTPIPDPTKLSNPNTFARFGTKTLTFSGEGSGNNSMLNTIITGNVRIYTNQSDRSSGVPVGITINNLRLSCGETFNAYTSPN